MIQRPQGIKRPRGLFMQTYPPRTEEGQTPGRDVCGGGYTATHSRLT
jgi:hypothetical protein